MSAPGEVLSFDVSAVDQCDNWKTAIWSVDSEMEEVSQS